MLCIALTVALSANSPGLNLIPWPVNVKLDRGSIFLRAQETIGAPSQLNRLAEIVSSEVKIAFGANWKPSSSAVGTIELRLDPKLKEEEYRVDTRKKVLVIGGSYRAVAMGTATLLQSIIKSGDRVSVPRLVIQDSPAKAFRGLMVDVARRYHSIATLEQCVELCRLYKIRYLQLHLSDDQSFTFPSRAFPKLNTVNQHGGLSYTREELIGLVKFADDRGVTIIPEIEMPGHAAAMIRAMPDLFKIGGTKPYEHHATVNFANAKVLEALNTIIGEACEIFASSPYFHMGGDEADISLADQHPDFQSAFQELGLPPKSQQEIFRRFIGQIQESVEKRGKQLIVWEGFGRNPASKFPISKRVLVMEFESAYYQPADLLQDGYQLVNAAWTPLYVVNRHVWPAKKVYDWDLSKFGRFTNLFPTVEWALVPSIDRVIGAQVCAWEQPEHLEITNLRRLLPAMAERIWILGSMRTYADFSERLQSIDNLLDRLIQPVAITTSKLNELGPDDFDLPTFTSPITITMTPRGNGTLRFTTDGTAPTNDSPVYMGPITLDKTTTLRAALFEGDHSSYETAKTFYYAAPKTPNLATGKKVTVSGGTQGPQAPQLAVDDNLDLGSSWWAGPAPQWLQVDLGKPEKVDRIELFPYWDGRRYYQYRIESSLNGKDWTELVDRRSNTVPAKAEGDEHRFPATSMRFVRVHMLKGSANEGVHIVEVKVWPARGD